MHSITIPRKLAKQDDLVVIPKREYEAFSRWKRAVRVRLAERWFWTPEWQRKEAEADRAIRRGRVSRPYADHRKLFAALKRKRK